MNWVYNKTNQNYSCSFIYVVFLVLLLGACQSKRLNKPKVEKGMMNLSTWNFEEDGVLKLNGDWALIG